MSFLGGIFGGSGGILGGLMSNLLGSNSFLGSLLSNTGLGSILSIGLGVMTGGLSFTLQTLATSVASSLLQGAVESLGLPEGLENMLMSTITDTMGTGLGTTNPGSLADMLSDLFGGGPQTTGAVNDTINNMQDVINDFIQNMAESQVENDDEAGGAEGKGGWIRELARALGEIADESYNDLMEAKDTAKAAQGDEEKGPAAMIEFSGASQEFNMIMQTLTTIIKTVGEAAATAARKQ